ncbi:PhnD/SsuA/transferrin family substrate-binding protein, partial [Acinetobacter baumannii]
DEVLAGTIDVGPLDAYWHRLIARERPEIVAGIRVIDSTALAPIPAFVASAGLPVQHVEALRRAFAQAQTRPWFAGLGESLCITGFKPVDQQ